MVEGVFKFQDYNATSCLTIIFQMATRKRNHSTYKYPSGPMLRDIEESCLYMIELAKSSKLDLEKILNHTSKTGNTLFSDASAYSEEITKRLLLESVRVNSVSDKFATPFFRVRLKVCFMKITSSLVQ